LCKVTHEPTAVDCEAEESANIAEAVGRPIAYCFKLVRNCVDTTDRHQMAKELNVALKEYAFGR